MDVQDWLNIQCVVLKQSWAQWNTKQHMESGRGEIADVISVGSMVLLSVEEAQGYKGSIFYCFIVSFWMEQLIRNKYIFNWSSTTWHLKLYVR